MTDTERLVAFWSYHAERTEQRAAQLAADGYVRVAAELQVHALKMRDNARPRPIQHASAVA